MSMEAKTFFYHRPLFGELFSDTNIEYHIKYQVSDDFEDAYEGNTKRCFIRDVYKYMTEKYSEIIKSKGMDDYYDEDGRIQYIYIHVAKKDSEKEMDKIMNDLENKYITEWSLHQVPSLLTICKKQLRSSRAVGQAVSDFQRRHGYEETQRALYVLHNDVMRRYR